LFLDRFGFSIYLLKNHSYEIHLALGQGLHFIERLSKLVFVSGGLESLHDFFIVEKLFLLELSLNLLRVKEL
jgi:hypothetical protein